jgi:hypothetical protein
MHKSAYFPIWKILNRLYKGIHRSWYELEARLYRFIHELINIHPIFPINQELFRLVKSKHLIEFLIDINLTEKHIIVWAIGQTQLQHLGYLRVSYGQHSVGCLLYQMIHKFALYQFTQTHRFCFNQKWEFFFEKFILISEVIILMLQFAV